MHVALLICIWDGGNDPCEQRLWISLLNHNQKKPHSMSHSRLAKTKRMQSGACVGWLRSNADSCSGRVLFSLSSLCPPVGWVIRKQMAFPPVAEDADVAMPHYPPTEMDDESRHLLPPLPHWQAESRLAPTCSRLHVFLFAATIESSAVAISISRVAPTLFPVSKLGRPEA